MFVSLIPVLSVLYQRFHCISLSLSLSLSLSSLSLSLTHTHTHTHTFSLFPPPPPPPLPDPHTQYQLVPQPPPRVKCVSVNDQLIIEDQVQRVILSGNISPSDYVTGVVMGFYGKELRNGSFEVEDVCFPEMPEQEEIVAMETDEEDKYVGSFPLSLSVSLCLSLSLSLSLLFSLSLSTHPSLPLPQICCSCVWS